MTKPAFDYLVAIDFEATCDENYAEPSNVLVPRGQGEIIEVPFVVVSMADLYADAKGGEVEAGDESVFRASSGEVMSPEGAGAEETVHQGHGRRILAAPKPKWIVHQAQIYVKPESTPVTPYCTQLTGIKEEMLVEAPSLKDALGQVDAWVEENILAKGHTFAFVTHGMYDLRNMLWCEAKTKGFLHELKDHWFRFFDVTVETLKWNERKIAAQVAAGAATETAAATEGTAGEHQALSSESISTPATPSTPSHYQSSGHKKSVLRIELDASNPRRYRKRVALFKLCTELGIQPRGRLHSGIEDAMLITQLMHMVTKPLAINGEMTAILDDLYVTPMDIHKELRAFRRDKSTVLHCEGLPFKVTLPEIEAWCTELGFKPKAVHALRTVDNTLTGCAYFEFGSHAEADRFLTEVHGKAILERCVILTPSDAKELELIKECLDQFPVEAVPEQTRDDQFALAEDENWLCGICKFTNRNGRPSCYKCNARHPHRQHKSNAHPRAKDNWSCPTCAQFNYAFRFSCIKCKRASSHPPQPMKPVHRNLLKPGDWLCTNAVCRAVNHNNRPQCYRCDTDARKTVTASPVAAVQPSDDGFAAPVGKSWRKPEQKKTVAPALTNRQRLDREAEKGFKMNVGGGFASLAIDDDGEDDDDEDEE